MNTKFKLIIGLAVLSGTGASWADSVVLVNRTQCNFQFISVGGGAFLSNSNQLARTLPSNGRIQISLPSISATPPTAFTTLAEYTITLRNGKADQIVVSRNPVGEYSCTSAPIGNFYCQQDGTPGNSNTIVFRPQNPNSDPCATSTATNSSSSTSSSTTTSSST